MKYLIAYLIVFLLFGCAERHKADAPNPATRRAGTALLGEDAQGMDRIDSLAERLGWDKKRIVLGKVYANGADFIPFKKPKKKKTVIHGTDNTAAFQAMLNAASKGTITWGDPKDHGLIVLPLSYDFPTTNTFEIRDGKYYFTDSNSVRHQLCECDTVKIKM